MARKERTLCGACAEVPPRAPGQYYCQKCQRERDRVSERGRRAELRALREEVKALRRAVLRAKEALAVEVPL